MTAIWRLVLLSDSFLNYLLSNSDSITCLNPIILRFPRFNLYCCSVWTFRISVCVFRSIFEVSKALFLISSCSPVFFLLIMILYSVIPLFKLSKTIPFFFDDSINQPNSSTLNTVYLNSWVRSGSLVEQKIYYPLSQDSCTF